MDVRQTLRVIPPKPTERAPREDPRQMLSRLQTRESVLSNNQSEWRVDWRDISMWCFPFRSRMPEERTPRRRPKRRSSRTINDTPRMALHNCGAGLSAGITSPARPWFRTGLPGYDEREDSEVGMWLEMVEREIRDTFTRSNLYTSLPTLYTELAAFGTALLEVIDEGNGEIRTVVHTCGSYLVALDNRWRPTTTCVSKTLTVEQLVDEYGLENCSAATQRLYEDKKLDETIQIRIWTMPNKAHVEGSMNPRERKFERIVYEYGVTDSVLQHTGYFENPMLVVRWETLEEEPYGQGPGAYMLGDAKAVQVYERHKAKLIAKLVNPAFVAPANLKNEGLRVDEGSTTYADMPGRDSLRPAHEVPVQGAAAIGAEILVHENRIRRSAFEDLFLMLASSDRRQVTAREVEERHEEKIIMLGPVLERIYSELLQLLIDRTFGILYRAGKIAMPPEQVGGQPIKVEFVGILATAQKAVGVASQDRFLQSVAAVAQLKPEALDKFDGDQAIDVYRDILGASPSTVIPDEQVAQARARRQQMQQMQQLGAAATTAGGAAKDFAAATAQIQPSAMQEALRIAGLA